MRKLVATTEKELYRINDIVHDRFFLFDDIWHSAEDRLIEIPLTVLSRDIADVFDLTPPDDEKRYHLWTAVLRIWNVEDFEVVDKAQTGEIDINYIKYDLNHVRIVGGLPAEVRVHVTDLRLELEILADTGESVSKFRGDYLRS
jgi:hypothetical protein